MPTSSDDRVRIGDAEFPKPFVNGLEFNAPVHGTWNIVHIGFRIPKRIRYTSVPTTVCAVSS